MEKRYHLWSFYLCLFTLLATGQFIYSSLNQSWIIAPPTYILWVFAFIAFIYGIRGRKSNSNKWDKPRSWVTILLSLLLVFLLTVGVLRSLLIWWGYMDTTQSPEGDYTIDFYQINGGAATSIGVVGELDGPLWFKKTIYDDWNRQEVDVEWMNNHTVKINDYVLDLEANETYSDN